MHSLRLWFCTFTTEFREHANYVVVILTILHDHLFVSSCCLNFLIVLIMICVLKSSDREISGSILLVI